MSRTTTALRYFLTILLVLVINVVVFTLSPGNWLTAMGTSIIAMTILLPSTDRPYDHNPVEKPRIARKKNSEIEKDSPAFNNEIQCTGEQDITSKEEEALHSMLGSVFNNMAQNASLDMYSSEMTSTNGSVRQEGDLTPVRKDPVSIELETDPDGKLHYIFQENKVKFDSFPGRETKGKKIRNHGQINEMEI
ncbi:MAG: hypothetical protein ACFFD4_01885 [Candidatus Odinarchaeota archaeon]